MIQIEIPCPDFDVSDDEIVAHLKERPGAYRGSWRSAESDVRRRKVKAYAGYLENAFLDADAYLDVKLPDLILRALEWADAEWMGYP